MGRFRFHRSLLAAACAALIGATAQASEFQMIYKVSGIKQAAPTEEPSAFTSHTFTTCGAEGRLGPSITQCQSAYVGAEILKPEYAFEVAQGIQHWTVPVSGRYRIEAVGAAGAHSTNGSGQGGRGASIAGDFELSKGTVLKIVVGQRGRGGPDTARRYPAGGGGSFVYIDAAPADPLLIAGGGGGIRGVATTGAHGQASVAAGEAKASSSEFTGLPGQFVGVGHGSWITASRYQCSGGGAGWLSQGADSQHKGGAPSSPSKTGSNYCGNYGAFGSHVGAAQPFAGGYGVCAYGDETGHVGGFGGGGGGGCGGEGGGGGYTGGAGTYSDREHGGGGGSFNAGANPENRTGVNAGHGRVTISKL